MEYVELTLKIPKSMKQDIKTRVVELVKNLINDNTYTGAKAKSDADKQEFEQLNQGA